MFVDPIVKDFTPAPVAILMVFVVASFEMFIVPDAPFVIVIVPPATGVIEIPPDVVVDNVNVPLSRVIVDAFNVVMYPDNQKYDAPPKLYVPVVFGIRSVLH